MIINLANGYNLAKFKAFHDPEQSNGQNNELNKRLS